MCIVSAAEGARLRRARRERILEEKGRKRRDAIARDFWDNIDTSGGADACHPWTGERKWNHCSAKGARYECGNFNMPGVATRIASRLVCLLTYGREIPANMDVTPLCDDHLCCNVRHLMVTEHNKSMRNKLVTAKMVEEFFCADVAA